MQATAQAVETSLLCHNCTPMDGLGNPYCTYYRLIKINHQSKLITQIGLEVKTDTALITTSLHIIVQRRLLQNTHYSTVYIYKTSVATSATVQESDTHSCICKICKLMSVSAYAYLCIWTSVTCVVFTTYCYKCKYINTPMFVQQISIELNLSLALVDKDDNKRIRFLPK